MKEITNNITRRQFLTRSAKAGVAVAAVCTIGYTFYDPQGPGGFAGDTENEGLPDFSIPGQSPRMSIVQGTGGYNRTQALHQALKAIGGIESFIKEKDRVLLKVNAAFATPPMLGATTHPELIAEMARLCFKAKADAVIVTDNPINDPLGCFTLTGIDDAVRSVGAQVMLPKEQYFKSLTVPDAELIRDWPILHEPLQQVNKVIGLAPVKDHHRSGASMVMKNWYGLLGGRRNIFHQDIHNIIKELAVMVKPTLVILDGTTTMMTNGPTGGSLSDLKQTNTLIVGTDQVAVDAFGATLLGKGKDELAFIAKAEAAGAGTADFRSLNPEIITI